MSQATLGSTPYRNSSLFSGYYLEERIDTLEGWDCDGEAEQAFETLRELWELEADLVASYNENELLDSWIDDVIDVLGFGTLSETTLPDGGGHNDRLLFESAETRRDAAKRKRDGETEAMYGLASAVLEAKQWDAEFTRRFSEQRSYRDASHQIKYYLERTPERLKWGILTNGKKWRLYGTKDYATEIYYEVDLPELLESGDVDRFKYFYAFFRSAAFRETAGTAFLDTVWNESETAAQELGEDLQDNVFTALRVLGEGFIHTNDLEIDPDDEAAREELKEQSLVLLYRLMFVLYAESRGLIHPDDPDKQAEYDENFSLDEIRLSIHEEIASGDSYDDYSGYATQYWGQLEDLFGLIDSGQEELGIPPYNGGLFDDDQHAFLAENEVADRYIAEVIHRLGTTENGEGPVLADYADLDTRHLGSIYEGLLEHEFRIAPEAYAAVAENGGQVWKPATEVTVAEAVETVDRGELYVVNDDGERKATGAYYTPDYVVSYIVEETVDPLLADIKGDLESDGLEPADREYFARFWQSVLDLKLLDPAMGSAHFLTNATGYLTEQVMEVVREQEIQSYDEQYIRRQIAKECIYGVDINGMAVELGKLSMWLETLAADQPLAFLDHHIKPGNSLVGSDITEVLSDDPAEEVGQITLGQAFARARRDTLDHVMDLMQELLAIDNETLEDIKSMEEIYREIRADPLYKRLFEIANVHTAEAFGQDVPEGVYEAMAGAIEDESEWAAIRGEEWFINAQELADEQGFFHWELEFPEVFFDIDGEKLDGAGFDAVVGNPPYVRQEQLKDTKPYLKSYKTYDGVADLYVYFIEKGENLLKHKGQFGQIISNKFMKASYGAGLRKLLTQSVNLKTIVNFGDLPVFESASAYPSILLFEAKSKTHQKVRVAQMSDLNFTTLKSRLDMISYEVSTDELGENQWSLSSKEVSEVYSKFEDHDQKLEQYLSNGIKSRRGVLTGYNDAFFISAEKRQDLINKDSSSEEVIKPLITGKDVRRYYIDSKDQYLIFTRRGINIEKYPAIKDHLSKYKEHLEPQPRGHSGDWDGRKPGDYEWYEIQDSVEYWEEFKSEKICYPEIAATPRFTLDTNNYFPNNKCFIFSKEDWYLNSLLNSTAAHFWFDNELSTLRGGYYQFRTVHLKEYPIPEISDTKREKLSSLAKKITGLIEDKNDLNLSLLDHLGSYSDGQTLSDIGLTQPPKGAADSILQQTTEQRPNLRVGTCEIVREDDNTVEIRLTARYKPDEEGDYKTDQWGYTETEPLPALRITDLTGTEADLIEQFVPVACEEAGGFAGFRETATKTNSLVDRLRKLTLPAVADVREGLEGYIETKERAEELEAKIERTDALIDEIVYELYGLTEEEIEIVEDAVGE